jgi:hypothetical protein
LNAQSLVFNHQSLKKVLPGKNLEENILAFIGYHIKSQSTKTNNKYIGFYQAFAQLRKQSEK